MKREKDLWRLPFRACGNRNAVCQWNGDTNRILLGLQGNLPGIYALVGVGIEGRYRIWDWHVVV